MRKFTQKLSVFLLTLITMFTVGHKKVKAEGSTNIRYDISSIDNNRKSTEEEEHLLDEEEIEKSNIEKQIDVIEYYYKDANISRDCILLMNYQYLKSMEYKFPAYLNTSDLNAIPLIKNTQYGWNTINLSFATDPEKCSNIKIDPENWRELEKLYLKNFTNEIRDIRVLRYSPLILNPIEREVAEEIEDLCYDIYEEYRDSNGNLNSIRLNILVLKLKEKIEDENLYTDKSNGFYIVMSEILGEFRTLFTMIDIKYVEIGSISASKSYICRNDFIMKTAFLITNENMYDESFGLYSCHPYSKEYTERENDYNRVILSYTTKPILEVHKLKEPIINLQRVKRNFINKVSTIMNLTGNHFIDMERFSSNFFQTLNYKYANDTVLVHADNYDIDDVYNNIASIYRLNSEIMNNNYNPNSINYKREYINNSYANLIVPYSDLILDEYEYKLAKEIEDTYKSIINDFIQNVKVTYTNETIDNGIVSIMDNSCYNDIDDKLDSIMTSLDELETINHSETLNIILGMTVKQMNEYIESIVLVEHGQEIPNKESIKAKIGKINKKAKKLFGEHIERVEEKIKEQKFIEQVNVLTKIRVYDY